MYSTVALWRLIPFSLSDTLTPKVLFVVLEQNCHKTTHVV